MTTDVGPRGGAAKAIALATIAALALSGCATLQGIPQGFTSYDNLESTSATGQLKAADELATKFLKARNDNLKYAFWSNMALVPLAAGAAATVAFSGGKTAIAAIGIGSGAFLGINSFINARPNAKAYQAGLGALSCEIINLKPYVDKTKWPLSASVNQAITDAEPLENISSLQTKEAQLVGQLAAALQELKQAIKDGTKTAADADVAYGLAEQMPVFMENATRTIEQAVAARISQSDINYTTLVAGLTPKSTKPDAATPGAAAVPSPSATFDKVLNTSTASAANKAAKAAEDNDAQIIKSRIKKIQEQTKVITDRTAALNDTLTKFQLATAETAVTTCVKAI